MNIAILGKLAEPSLVVRLAQTAEAAGWEALFVWDHLAFVWGTPAADPWVVLAAAAQATTRLRLGTAVTPLPRHSPGILAQAVATLDRLSGGRIVLGVGLGGVPAEFEAFGEDSSGPVHAQKLDEGLTVVPVWIGGNSRAALRRAARWDGWLKGGDDDRGRMTVPPQRLAADVRYLRECGGTGDVALIGSSRPSDGAMVRAYAEAGATWWLEHLHGRRGAYDELLARVAAGPPS